MQMSKHVSGAQSHPNFASVFLGARIQREIEMEIIFVHHRFSCCNVDMNDGSMRTVMEGGSDDKDSAKVARSSNADPMSFRPFLQSDYVFSL